MAVEENVILTTASVVLGCDRVIFRTMNGIQVEAFIAASFTVPPRRHPAWA